MGDFPLSQPCPCSHTEEPGAAPFPSCAKDDIVDQEKISRKHSPGPEAAGCLISSQHSGPVQTIMGSLGTAVGPWSLLLGWAWVGGAR